VSSYRTTNGESELPANCTRRIWFRVHQTRDLESVSTSRCECIHHTSENRETSDSYFAPCTRAGFLVREAV
jgi:hypothetical protein